MGQVSSTARKSCTSDDRLDQLVARLGFPDLFRPDPFRRRKEIRRRSRNEVIPVDWHGKSRAASAFGPRRASHSLARFSLRSSNSILRCRCVPRARQNIFPNVFSFLAAIGPAFDISRMVSVDNWSDVVGIKGTESARSYGEKRRDPDFDQIKQKDNRYSFSQLGHDYFYKWNESSSIRPKDF